MSIQAVGWALDVRDTMMHPTTKFALVALCNYADDQGVCWPSQERLARDTGHSDRTIRAQMKRLETLGYIERTKRVKSDGTRTSDAYKIIFEARRKNLPLDDQPPETHDTPTGNPRPNPPEQISGKPSLEPSLVEPSETLCAESAPRGYPGSFELFWKPLKSEKLFHKTPLGTKAEAFNEWDRHAKTVPPEALEVAWRSYLASCRRTDTSTRHVCRWLKYRGWEEDYGPPMSVEAMAEAARHEKWRRDDEGQQVPNREIGHQGSGERQLLTQSEV